MDMTGIRTGQDFLDRVRASGGIATDGPRTATTWRYGWAVHPFVGRDGTAHWWRRTVPDAHFVTDGIDFAVHTLCGLSSIETRYIEGTASKGVYLLSPGNCPRCRHCAKKARLRALK